MARSLTVESLPSGSAEDKISASSITKHAGQLKTKFGAVVKYETGLVWHKFKKSSHWEHAVYHQLIRPHLIDFENTKGDFDFQPDSGHVEEADITSYHSGQKTWGPTRENFPSVLFTYARPPHEGRAHRSNLYMYFNHMIVLDKDHLPVRAFPELNSTLSSKIEGFRLEALFRLNPGITSKDILARMPTETTVTRGYHEVIRPQIKANALSMRRREFRARNAMLTWAPREGSEKVKEYLDWLLGPDMVALNNTRDMRPLTEEEINHLLRLGKGTHPERSRYKGVEWRPSKARTTRKRSRTEFEEVEPSDLEVPTDHQDHPETVDASNAEDDDLDNEGSVNLEEHFDPLDPDEVDDEDSSLLPASPASIRGLADFDDWRNRMPVNMNEIRAVAEAMQPTIEQYKSILSTSIMFDTSSFDRESYNTQWFAMQEALEVGWLRQGRGLEECPRLIRLAHWTGDMWNWQEAPLET